MLKRLLAALLLFLTAAQAPASAWISAEGGRSEYFRRGAVLGGMSLGKAEAWAIQGSLAQSMTLLPDDSAPLYGRELGLGVGYFPSPAWDFSLDGIYGGDSSELRYGGATASLGGHVGEDDLKAGLTLIGGSMHYRFAPEESLRQRSAGAQLRFDLGTQVVLGLAGNGYSYDRDLYSGGGSTQGGGLFGGGPLGALQPAQGPLASGGFRSGAQRDPLLPGFPLRDWSSGLSVDLGLGALIGGDYSQTEIIENGSWVKVVDAFWRQEITKPVALKLFWSKAVEGGAGSSYFSLAVTWSFGGQLEPSGKD